MGASASSRAGPARGAVVELAIERLDARGEGVARLGAVHVHARHAIPGSLVRARVVRRRRRKAWASVLETLEPGALAVEPRCAHFGTCGGCAFQNLAYPAQLEVLRQGIERELAAAGFGQGVAVESVLPSPRIWHYRNKMDFTFGNRPWLGAGELDVPGRHDKVLDVGDCAIAFEQASPILRSARTVARALGLSAWDVREHRGLLRHLVLRKGHFSGEILVALVTSEDADAAVDAWARELGARHPEVSTLVQLVNTRPASVALGERERVLHGPGTIRELLNGLEYTISAGSFFQTNSEQASELVRIVREEALGGSGLAPSVWDLYCGAGTFSLDLARWGARVVGVELASSAVADAERNARANCLAGVRFLRGEVERLLADPQGLGDPPQVVVVDPPRAGLHPRALLALGRSLARRLVLVSCNPRAGARDAASLARAGWRLTRVRPLDLFPHTPHVECVFCMDRAT